VTTIGWKPTTEIGLVELFRGAFRDAATVQVWVALHHTGCAVRVRIDDHPELGAGVRGLRFKTSGLQD
jgi:hypothetical protein